MTLQCSRVFPLTGIPRSKISETWVCSYVLLHDSKQTSALWEEAASCKCWVAWHNDIHANMKPFRISKLKKKTRFQDFHNFNILTLQDQDPSLPARAISRLPVIMISRHPEGLQSIPLSRIPRSKISRTSVCSCKCWVTWHPCKHWYGSH